MTAAATTSRPPKSAIDPKLIVPVINSIRAVFLTMLKLKVNVERPHIKSSPMPSYDVSGVIGFSGGLTGSIVVSFKVEVAVKIASAFAGMTLEPTSPDFPDAVGELANMIAGGAKKSFSSVACITVPSVIIGGGHTIARLRGVPCLVIPCQTELGDFAVEVNIKKIGGTKQ